MEGKPNGFTTRDADHERVASYSTVWLAKALSPTGKVVTIEKSETYAQVLSLRAASHKSTHLVASPRSRRRIFDSPE